MVYDLKTVKLGKTDLEVTRFCQGTAFRNLDRASDDPRSEGVLRHALDRGVNFFDTAQAYGWGGSEALLGKVLAGKRAECVLCTKVPAFLPPDTNGYSGARVVFTESYLTAQLEDSLRRLQTEYVDLYLLHGPDGTGSWEEVGQTMDKLGRAGKIRYWGLSNHASDDVIRCISVTKDRCESGPSVLEEYYTVAGYAMNTDGESRTRILEREMFPLINKNELGLMAFSPMDAGQLAPTNRPAPGSALDKLTIVLDAIAKDMEISRPALCTAWSLAHPSVTSVLAGPESSSHLDEILTGATFALPEDALRHMNNASHAYSDAIELKGRNQQ